MKFTQSLAYVLVACVAFFLVRVYWPRPAAASPVASNTADRGAPTASSLIDVEDLRIGPIPLSLDDGEDWYVAYDGASHETLEAAADALARTIDQISGPTLDAMLVAGRGQYLGPENSVDSTGVMDETLVCRLYIIPGRGAYYVILPPAEYPDVYTLKQRLLWLREQSLEAHAREHHSGK